MFSIRGYVKLHVAYYANNIQFKIYLGSCVLTSIIPLNTEALLVFSCAEAEFFGVGLLLATEYPLHCGGATCLSQLGWPSPRAVRVHSSFA